MTATSGRLILDSSAAGSWNMAVDQALLESCEKTEVPTLRIYDWEPATVSLGYFQSFAHREKHTSSLKCPIVRRRSGGGAIVHDVEITYSLCFPSRERWASRNQELYTSVHQSLIDLLERYSIKARLFERSKKEDPNKDPFLCFQRRAIGDLMIDNNKVGGSAQRRAKQALLQHGSVLLEKSHFAPELPGIADLSSFSLNKNEFLEDWVNMLTDCLSIDLTLGSLTNDELEVAKTIEEKIFGNFEWTGKR